MNFTFLEKYFGYFVKGAEITIVLAFFAVLFGTILGLGITLIRRSKFKAISFIGTAYVEFMRGTPLLVQIYIIYIGLPKLIGIDLPDIRNNKSRYRSSGQGADGSCKKSWYESKAGYV